MILCDDNEFDPSYFIIPTNGYPYFLIATKQKEDVPFVAPVEYTPTNPFVLEATSTLNISTLIEQTCHVTSLLIRSGHPCIGTQR